MAQLELVFSREFDSGFAETVKAKLGAYLEITGPYFRFQKAAEPSLGPPQSTNALTGTRRMSLSGLSLGSSQMRRR